MFSEISQGLLNGKLDIGDAIQELRGNDGLLRWFACDCAERALRRERSEGLEWDPRSVRALALARKQVLGDVTAPELLSARFAARDAARSSSAGSDAAKCAIDESPTWAAGSASEASARAAFQHASPGLEIRWQRQRLAYLCEVWEICGHRAAWLLFEHKCPISPPHEAAMLLGLQQA